MKKTPTKYIFILFLAMYTAACLSPITGRLFHISGAKLSYLATIPIMYLLLVLGDIVLTKIANLFGDNVWMDIYERPLRGKERIYGLDVVRFFAVISVPAIHFLGLTGYYTTPLKGSEMFLATCVRWLFICCVPIFLTLTGYFKHKKGIDFAHYKCIFVILATHIFITCIRLYVDKAFHGEELTRAYVMDKLVYFEYGWYVKLYIAMMLLIPFLNLIWEHLESRFHKELLILTLILLCSMGPLTFDIVPPSWVIIYVFIYYFMGAYLCEYEVYINKWLNLLLILLMLLVTSAGSFLHTDSTGCFDWSFGAYSQNSGYSSLPAIIMTFLIITMLIDADTHFKPIRAFFYSFAVVSLEMYMLSQMFDGLVYPKLDFTAFTDIFPRMPLVVGFIVLISYGASQIKRLIFFILSLPLYILHKK